MKNILIGIMALTLLAACGKEPQPLKLVADIDAGRDIARVECSDCHGMDGRGDSSKIPNLAAQPVEYLVKAMHDYRDNLRHHAALQDLILEMSEQNIIDIAGYYAMQPPLQVIETPTTESFYIKGAAVAAVCEECHGERGISTTEGVPNLAGQQPIYLLMATMEYQNGSRGHVEKKQMLEGLHEVDIEKMALYFAAQVPPVRQPPAFGDPVAGKPLSAECGECHGANGVSGDPMVPSLAAQEPVYLVASIKAYRDQERSHEEMETDITDQEIESIAAYYTVQHAEAAGAQQSTVQELVAKCDRCHNSTSSKRKLLVPSLNGQSLEYLIKAMQAYRGENRENSMMHKMSSRYSDEMIEAMADYYSAQPN